MLESLFKNKKNQEEPMESVLKKLDAQYIQMALEIEKLKNLREKIEKIDDKLKEFERVLNKRQIKPLAPPVSARTKEAIKLILQKYGETTASQLSKLIKLSRTRCNEYLKEMESEGVLTSKVVCRKKYYMLRQ